MSARLAVIAAPRLRTAWMLWMAWTVIGAIIAFEDSGAGSGTLSLILVAPFWALWGAWPLIALWLRISRGPAPLWSGDVQIAGSKVAAMVLDDGLWLEALGVEKALGCPLAGLHESRPQAPRVALCSARRLVQWARSNGRPGLVQDLSGYLG